MIVHIRCGEGFSKTRQRVNLSVVVHAAPLSTEQRTTTRGNSEFRTVACLHNAERPRRNLKHVVAFDLIASWRSK